MLCRSLAGDLGLCNRDHRGALGLYRRLLGGGRVWGPLLVQANSDHPDDHSMITLGWLRHSTASWTSVPTRIRASLQRELRSNAHSSSGGSLLTYVVECIRYS